MGKVPITDINALRKSTGAGLMDCKKALQEADGNHDRAIEILRKKGQKVVAKRSDRESSEGIVLTKVNKENTRGVLFSLNCETDFVAKTDKFRILANQLVELALEHDNKIDFLKSSFGNSDVGNSLVELTGVIGEKLEIGTLQILEAPFVGSYVHNGNRVAALVGLSINVPESGDVAENLAMQVVAMKPIAVDENDVSQEVIAKEEEIAKDVLRKEGKPDHLLNNIVRGKLKKFFSENTLIHQKYISDDKKSVSQFISSVNPLLKVTNFKLYNLS